jgi:Lrp/AsnC family leucine-responsive transcriptional regulator
MNYAHYVLDKIDRRILYELRQDGRLTVTQLSEKVGLSSSPCWTRVKRLENLNIIEGYTAKINSKAKL